MDVAFLLLTLAVISREAAGSVCGLNNQSWLGKLIRELQGNLSLLSVALMQELQALHENL